MYGERRGVYIVLMGKPEGRRLLGRPMRRCVINIKMDVQEVGWVDWIYLAEVRDRRRAILNAVIKLRFL